MLCLILLVIIAVILLLHVFVEFYYFIRAGICVLYARVCKTKTHVLDETRITGFCIPRDVDHLLTHMNNARFLRELDFAKVDFFERTGLFRRMYKDKGHFFVSATTIRYRRFIKLFSRYIITTRIVYWDDQNVYIEHRFLTPSNNFINAIILCKIRFMDCKVNELMDELIANSPNKSVRVETTDIVKPKLTEELEKWIEYNEISSAALRQSNTVD